MAGYYCEGGAKASVPDDNNVMFTDNGPCILGHYCPEGTPVYVPCPIGMLRNALGI